MPVASFAEALARLGDAVTITELQITRTDAEPARTASERRLREYAGDPAQVARAAAGHEVLVVHGAPVSAEVAGRARTAPGLLCPRRPGQRRRRRRDRARHPGGQHARQERRGGRRADHRVRAHADPRAAAGQPVHRRWRQARRIDVRGPGVLRPRGPRHGARPGRPRSRRPAGGDPGAALGFTVLAHDPRAARGPCPTRCTPGRLRGAAGRVRHRLGARHGRRRPTGTCSAPRPSP